MENTTGNILDQALQKPVPVSAETFAAIVRIARDKGVVLLLPDERSAYEKALPRWKNSFDAVNRHTYIEAKAAWLSHQQKMADRIAAGHPVTDKEDGWTRDDWNEDYRSKMSAAKMAGTQVVGEIVQIVKPAFDRFEKFCEDFAIEQEVGEMSVSESLCIPYSPSMIVRTIRSAPAAVKHYLPGVFMWGHNPEKMVGWLIAQ
jgi:hypothetical protein